MKHYGDFEVIVKSDRFTIVLVNQHTGVSVQVDVPRIGAFSEPRRGTERAKMDDLAKEIAKVLRQSFP